MQPKLTRPACILLAILCIHLRLFSQTGVELYEKAQRESEKSNLPEAIRLALLAAERIKADSGENHVLYAKVLDDLVSFYLTMNKVAEAEPYSDTAMKIFENQKGINSLEYAYGMHNVGNIAAFKGEFERAEKKIRESLAIIDEYDGQKDPKYLHGLNTLAFIYYQKEDYNKAIPFFIQIVNIYKRHHPQRMHEYVYFILNLGELYRSIGSYNKSVDYLKEALELFSSGKIPVTHPAYSPLLNVFGVLQMSLTDYSQSETYLQKAVDHSLTHSGKSDPFYLSALNNLGHTQFLRKKYQEAITSYLEVLDLLRMQKGEAGLEYARTLNNLALVYGDKGELAVADSLLTTVKQLCEKLPGTSDLMLAGITQNQGIIHQWRGNNQQAFNNYVEADNTYINYITRNFYGLSAQDKLNLTASMQISFQTIPSLLQQQNIFNTSEAAEEMYHVQLALKNMVLRDQQSLFRSIRNMSDSSTIGQFTEWKTAKNRLAQQGSQQAGRTKVTDSVEEKIDQLEQILAQKSSSFSEQQRYFQLSTKDVSGKLQPHEAAVEFLRFSVFDRRHPGNFYYAALVIQPGDSMPTYVRLCREDELMALLQPATCSPQDADKLIADLYQPVKNNGNLSKGTRLYNKIWKPLLPYLTRSNTIYIAPAGLLYQVSFQAIPAGSDKMLGDRYSFRYLLSTGDIAVKQINREPDIKNVSFWGNMMYDQEKAPSGKALVKTSFAATGNIYFDHTNKSNSDCKMNQTWSALQLGQKQVIDLSFLCRQKNVALSVYQRSEATEDTLKNTRFSVPAVLHISTHGFFIRESSKKPVQSYSDLQTSAIKSPDPLLRSGIILSGANAAWQGQQVTGREDGIVTAYEIAQMDLSNAHLVILDACESALGSIYGSEGVFGLQRAFRIAGADKIIMSLWKVPEKETNELMVNFYSQWLGGKPVYKALKDAQEAMRKKNLPPYYWAGFIVAE